MVFYWSWKLHYFQLSLHFDLNYTPVIFSGLYLAQRFYKYMEEYWKIFSTHFHAHTRTENTAGKHLSAQLEKSSGVFFEAKRLEAVMKANWGHGGSNKTVRHEDNMQLRIGQYINLLNSCTLPVKAMFPRCVSSYWNCAADLMRVIQCVWRSFSSALSSVTSVNHPSTTFPLSLSSVTLSFSLPSPFCSSPPLFFTSSVLHLLCHPPLTAFPFVVRQLYNVKETPQHTEEEVGAFTKLIEAMGFTGPLKYNKWVSNGGQRGR